ncbi:hypothetical protein VCHC55B2_2677A, partial [Vibrio cholerae HC-55B2]
MLWLISAARSLVTVVVLPVP